MNNKSANKTLIFVLAGIFLSGCASHAPVYAASFDCNKASTKIEKIICADSELSKLDGELQEAGGYEKEYKIIKQPIFGPLLNISKDFNKQYHREFVPDNEKKAIPECFIWQDNKKRWG